MIYHSAVFYPDGRDELMPLVSPIGNEEPIRAAILPHMRLEGVAPFYRRVFASIPDGKRLVILLPLHRETLEKDRGMHIFQSPEATEETPLGPVRVSGLGLPDGSPYEKEEYSKELFLPYIAYHNPSSPVHFLFARIERGAQIKELTRVLSPLADDDTIFLISSNMTGRLPECEVRKATEASVEAMLRGGHMMDLYQKGRVGACATPLIECVQTLLGGSWELIGIRDDDRTSGHAAFIMR